MNIARDVLAEIAARACTMRERLDEGIDERGDADEERIRARMERWCKVVAGGDRDRFERRLAWDGLSEGARRRILGGVRFRADARLPEWTETLREVMKEASATAIDDARAESPFAEIIVPFVRVAQRRLRARAGASYERLSGEAHAALEAELTARLTRLSTPTLFLELALARGALRVSPADLPTSPDEPLPRAKYLAFVEGLLRDGMRSFFLEYSVLGRLAAIALDAWTSATAELLERLDTDWPLLCQRFHGGADLGEVARIRAGGSDYHNGGRAVAILELSSGIRLVYKPRDLGMEDAYNALVTWLNERGAAPKLATLAVIDSGTHGWVEYAAHRPCTDGDEARRFYVRAGMLLCLTYVTGAIDLHAENVVACGEHPMLIDLETLTQPILEDAPFGEGPGPVTDPALQISWSTVLASQLLPRWVLSSDRRRAYDSSGLGGAGDALAPRSPLRFQHINTDVMSVERERGAAPAGSGPNLPVLAGVRLSPCDHRTEIATGFEGMYHLLVDARDELLAPGGPIDGLRGRRVRFVFRGTAGYAALLEAGADPSLLRDAADRAVELDALSAEPAALCAEHPAHWPVVESERRAIEELDVPYFTTTTDAVDLPLPGRGVAPRLFRRSCHEEVVATLRKLGDADLHRQLSLVRAALHARGACHPEPSLRPHDAAATVPLSPDAMLTQALVIAREIQRVAFPIGDGVCWVEVYREPLADCHKLRVVDADLYGGNLGVALFLAAAAAVSRDDGLASLAMKALVPVRRILDVPARRAKLGISLASGLGAILYGFVRIAGFLGEQALVDDARRAAALLTADRIEADAHLDVLGGAAGALLALLALHRATGDAAPLRQAILCGDHLLSKRNASEAGPRAWVSVDGALLTGLSHGAAGIAYALARLSDATHDARYLDAAREAIAYEQSTFSETAGRWPDLRYPVTGDGGPRFANAWCNGAAGIGLARLGGLAVLDDPGVRRDIDAALRLASDDEDDRESLCCGTVGRVELLHAAGAQLSRPSLLREAHARASDAVLRLSSAEGALRLHPRAPARPEAHSPALFQGMSGIGYTLLRLAHPERIPSVLLWE
ncbi:Lanthionine biosynthesis protein LanM [Minicystis rosea]|nr:Lanthionine biosynthesis protein LanM [Minicystis rosea]